MAELVDALDSKSSGQPCGFESHQWYQINKIVAKLRFYLFYNRGLEKEDKKSVRWTLFPTRLGEFHQWYPINKKSRHLADFFCKVPAFCLRLKHNLNNILLSVYYYILSRKSIQSNGCFLA